MVPKYKGSKNSSNPFDTFLIYVNFLIQKLTYDKYQYHSRYKKQSYSLKINSNCIFVIYQRVTCKLCLPKSRRNSNGQVQNAQYNACHHNESNLNFLENISDSKSSLTSFKSHSMKLCARHRVPSVCGSESGRGSLRKARSHSHISNRSDLASSTDLSEPNTQTSSQHFLNRRTRLSSLQNLRNALNTNTRSNRSKSFRSSNNNLTNLEANESSIQNKMLLIAAKNAASAVALASSNVSFQSNLQSSIRHKTHKDFPNRNVHFHLNKNEDDLRERPNKYLKIEDITDLIPNLTEIAHFVIKPYNFSIKMNSHFNE